MRPKSVHGAGVYAYLEFAIYPGSIVNYCKQRIRDTDASYEIVLTEEF
jgi:hypothetical protein